MLYIKIPNKVLKDPLVSSFIDEDPRRKVMIHKFFYAKDKLNNDNLNKEFKDYFLKIRLINYVIRLYESFTIEYKKKLIKRANREPLLLNQPSITNNEQDFINMVSLKSQPEDLEVDHFEERFEEIIASDELFNHINSLNSLQKTIIWKNIIRKDSLTEISQDLGVTLQNVSQVKKRAIKKLRGEMVG